MQPVWANRVHAASGLQTKRQLFLRTGRAAALLRPLGGGGVGNGTDLEQLRDSLGGPDDVELLQRGGKIVARQGCDPPSKESGDSVSTSSRIARATWTASLGSVRTSSTKRCSSSPSCVMVTNSIARCVPCKRCGHAFPSDVSG